MKKLLHLNTILQKYVKTNACTNFRYFTFNTFHIIFQYDNGDENITLINLTLVSVRFTD